jgi:hypothetical protein
MCGTDSITIEMGEKGRKTIEKVEQTNTYDPTNLQNDLGFNLTTNSIGSDGVDG